ncbi:MAG TPA: GWxTD domain-containing protein [Terracidiphilus sp.]|nr:GWxTD domain-containing protein [Terracidiphilus sp.]
MKSHFARNLACVLFSACILHSAFAADHAKDLPPHYRHWLNAEVNYIISGSEKKEFLTLNTDAERDAFIDTFWRIRNPDPGSSINSYKDEHYKRLAYANEHYGTIGRDDGWRTDRGRMYIILGPPKQVVTYLSARNVRPMEIWFYQSPSLALPPFFNLLFYKRSNSEDFTLYSPISDGPVRLVATLEAMNDQKRSLDTLRKSLGDEVATTAVSLIPGEPVDLGADTYEPSMSSDLLLGEIASLPDNPITQEKLDQNRARERVTTSVFLGGESASLSYVCFRDDRGRIKLSYLFNMKFADPSIVGTRKDGTNYYDLTLRSDVLTAAGKPAYSQEDRMTANLTPAEVDVASKKRFAAEATLPLAPGNYSLVVTLTNDVTKSATRLRTAISVPATKNDPVAFSGILAYRRPAGVPDPQNQLPFSTAHLRFTPLGAQNVYIRQGDKLPLVFQLWLGPGASSSQTSEKVDLHYVFGSIASSRNDAVQSNEVVDASNHDQAGNLLTGHTIDTSELEPGVYQVVLSAAREGEQKTAYATFNLHVTPANEYIDTWTAYGPADPGGEAVEDLKRGLSAEAQGDDIDAQASYERALSEGSGDMRPMDNLVALLMRKQMIDQLAALNEQPIFAKTAANPATLLAIAQALNKNGNPKAVVHLLEEQISLQPPNAELYAVLADACQATGNASRAKEVRAMAANLKQ